MYLTCLIPEKFLPFVQSAGTARIDFVTYRSLQDAWSVVDERRVDMFVSNPTDDYRSILDMLGALQTVSPNALHIHVYEHRTAEELIDLVNKSYAVRLLPLDAVEALLHERCVEGRDAIQLMGPQLLEIARLKEENEQFEFMLRQSLLS